MNNIKVGSYVGTGAAINIELGFIPDSVEVWNETDGDIRWDWRYGMTAAHALQVANHADTQLSRITANGITAYDPADYTNEHGFTVGTALSESGKTFGYRAYRNTQ